MKKKLWTILTVEAVVLIILNFLTVNIFKIGNIVEFPYIQISSMLRKLSLSGTVGNIAAWLLLLLISAIPVAIYYYLKKKKVNRNEDYILIAVAVLLLITLYLGINPTLILVGSNNVVDLALYFSILTTQIVFLYIVLKFLKADINSKNNLKLIISILFLTSIISVFNIFGPKLSQAKGDNDQGLIYTEEQQVYGDNDFIVEESSGILINYDLIGDILIFTNNNILDLVYVFLSMSIIGILLDMNKGESEESIVTKLYSLRKRTKDLFLISIAVSLAINFIFATFSTYFEKVEFKALLNLDLVIFILIINYIVNYLIKVKELKEENEMII